MSQPAELSVVILCEGHRDLLARTLAALRGQTARGRLELVFVCTSAAALGLTPGDVAGAAGHRLVELGDPLPVTSVGRAAGVRAAAAPVVAFAEDHSTPNPEWADALIARHRGEWAAVGPVMVNANPDRAMGWATFLTEYGEWAAPHPGGEWHHVPGHNGSYKRELLLPFGDALAGWLEAESALQWHLAGRGHRFYVEPRARTAHLNYERVWPAVRLRFDSGRLFAANRTRNWSTARRVGYAAGSPLIPVVRFARVARWAARAAPPRMLPVVLPAAAALLAVSAAGEFVGYAVGAGRSHDRLAAEEYRRERFLAGPATPPPPA